MKKISSTSTILIALLLGIVIGYVINKIWADDPITAKNISGYFDLISYGFLRLIKMIIAPLVFSTLTIGIAHMAKGEGLGRVGLKTMAWFLTASFISLLVGLILVNFFKPGVNLKMPLPDEGATPNIIATAMSLRGFMEHLIPRSFAEAMVQNEILSIVVFSLFFGIGAGASGDKAKVILDAIEGLAEIMLKITTYVMKVAPLAVFAAMASAISSKGIGILRTYALFMGEFYISLGVLWAMLILAGFFFVGSLVFRLLGLIKGSILLAFSTASSEAAYPKILESLGRFGISQKIGSFVLPLGYSFNLDGSMMYCTFAVLFIAQAYGIDLSLADQITMMLILMLTSKGMAGVPRASLVVIAGTLVQFHIPEAGLLLLIGIDQFLDMGRSATNVLGNSIATSVIAKSEGQWNMEIARGALNPTTEHTF